MSQKLGRPISVQLGWVYLVRLDGKRRKPRPRHVLGRPGRSKRRSKKPQAARPGGRHRLPGGARRALGRRRAPRRPEADPAQGLVLRRPAPDRAGPAPLRLALSRRLRPSRLGPDGLPSRHHVSASRSSRSSSPPSPARSAPAPPSRSCSSWTAPAGTPACKLRVPEHVHLLFLPPYSPELQPAEHLWPLTNTALANRHFATIEDLEDAQAERCVALQAAPISSARRRCSLGGRSESRNDKALGELRIRITSAFARPARPGCPSLRTVSWSSNWSIRSRVQTASEEFSTGAARKAATWAGSKWAMRSGPEVQLRRRSTGKMVGHNAPDGGCQGEAIPGAKGKR